MKGRQIIIPAQGIGETPQPYGTEKLRLLVWDSLSWLNMNEYMEMLWKGVHQVWNSSKCNQKKTK